MFNDRTKIAVEYSLPLKASKINKYANETSREEDPHKMSD